MPNNVNLGNRGLNVSLSSDLGATLDGNINLPFDIGQASVSGQVTDQGLTLSGMLSAGSELKLATGLNLPTRELELTVSTDPARMLELKGETQMPHFGFHRMTGIVNSDHFFFDGEIDRTLTFGSLEVPIGNGKLTIDSQTGLFLDANIQLPHLGSADMQGEITNQHILFKGAVNRDLPFDGLTLNMSEGDIFLNSQGAELNGTLTLPSNLKTARVSGAINESGMSLTGSMATTLRFHSVNFPISNSTVTASTSNGVSAVFNMNLFRFNPRLSGSISQSGSFNFTGSNNFNRSINAAGQSATFSGSINTSVSNSGIHLTGSGSVSYTGVLGNTITLASGPISFNPDWANRTIEACISSYCVNI